MCHLEKVYIYEIHYRKVNFSGCCLLNCQSNSNNLVYPAVVKGSRPKTKTFLFPGEGEQFCNVCVPLSGFIAAVACSPKLAPNSHTTVTVSTACLYQWPGEFKSSPGQNPVTKRPYFWFTWHEGVCYSAVQWGCIMIILYCKILCFCDYMTAAIVLAGRVAKQSHLEVTDGGSLRFIFP